MTSAIPQAFRDSTALLPGRCEVTTSLFERCLLVGPMAAFASGFLSGLRNVSRALGEILAMFVFDLDDFFIVCDISWIRHHPM